MKRTFLAATAILALTAPAFAHAASATQTLNLSASVSTMCGAGGQSGTPGDPSGDLNQTVAFGSIADADGKVQASTQSGHFGNLWCNAPSTVTMTATPLTTDWGSDPQHDTGSFTNTVNYTVTGSTWYLGAGNNSLTTAGSQASVSASVPGARETGTGTGATFDIKLVPPTRSGGFLRPIAGTYTGTVTMTLSAGS